MVAFPFKEEDPAVALSNLETAARHERVRHVLAVGASDGATFAALDGAATGLTAATRTEVEVVIQDRIGDRRAGKGDGMNTALRRFMATDLDRLHFYDADITNFDSSWISGAERAADEGHPLVRHYFPRASTDAMITWMITRPLFAIGHPHSVLWQIRQPLGGEVLLDRPMAARLVSDPVVARRSDWGIDTVITYATAASGSPIYEHYIPGGKQHALYRSLSELRDMVVECFEAALDVATMASPRPADHVVEPESPVEEAITQRVAYDVESSLHLLGAGWGPDEIEAAALLPDRIAEPLLANLIRPTFSFLDSDLWYETLRELMTHYRSAPGWQGVVFRLWVGRVLAYTTTDALGGHVRAMDILDRAITDYATRGRPN
ncbi:hypothetical protein BH23ACT5_BH23ACT5_03330 [soil metagenome]